MIMNKLTKTISIVIILLAVLSLSACGGNNGSNELVGSWKWLDPYGYPTILTFNADGTYVEHEASSIFPEGADYTGRYEVNVSEKTVILHTDPIPGDRVGYAPDLVFRYILAGDKLTVYYSYDTQETANTFTKVKSSS